MEKVTKFSTLIGEQNNINLQKPSKVLSIYSESSMFGKAMDIWALGCTFYQLIYNEFPFETGIRQEEFIHNLLNDE